MNQDDRLGPYRLLRRLGEGGMGVVHLAVDSQGREVAVKVLRAEVAGDEVARRRLAREVETMRRVRSEHIAEVLDADVTGRRPYIVTRYVAGPSLDEIVKQDGPLELPALARVARGVALALAAVHSVGVIHRDLKPGNVLIHDGEPVLIDFGIAQAVDATRLTQTGMFIGTPGYLAPEIIEGQEAGPEVDVHAWGGTLLYAATGQPPFGKGTLEMIFYNITAGKANVGAAPSEIQPLLRAALQRAPAKRPKAAELAERAAKLLPQAARSLAPDEISTVPHFDDTDPGDIPTPPIAPARPSSTGGAVLPAGPAAVAGPGAAPAARDRAPGGRDEAASAASAAEGRSTTGPDATGGQAGDKAGDKDREQDYVSLLQEQGTDGDPWPTRRVSPEELRRLRAGQPAQGQDDTPVFRGTGSAGRSAPGTPAPHGSVPGTGEPAAGGSGRPGAASASWDVPTRADAAAAPSGAWDVPTQADPAATPSASWDVPTQADPAATPSASWDVPTQADPAAAPSRPWPASSPQPGVPGSPRVPTSGSASTAPSSAPSSRPSSRPSSGSPSAAGPAVGAASPAAPGSEGDIPTQRVRPNELPDYIRNYTPPPTQAPRSPGTPVPPYPQQGPSPGDGYRPPPQPQHPAAPYGVPYGGSAAHPVAQPAPPIHPGQRPGQVLQRSRAYGTAAVMMLIIMTCLAVVAPVLVAAVAIPVAMLLRAADIAQPRFHGIRHAGTAALDVVRVFGQPVSLLKSVGITVALVPYAVILALPVTLLLTVLTTMPIENTLGWGIGVALWTICAGPGVEGPRRQMRRTLASLLPSRAAAMATAAVLAALAALMAYVAIGTLGAGATTTWVPGDVTPVVGQLQELRDKAAR